MSVKSAWRDGDLGRAVELEPLGPGRWRVRIDDSAFELSAEALADGRLRLTNDQGTTIAEVTADGAKRFVRLGRLDFVLEREADGRRRAAAPHHGGLEAPMPGAVTRVMVAAGDAVVQGQPLVAVEAMKMEHLIRAPRAGRVKRIGARAGDMVAPGTALVELEDEA